MGTVSQAVNMQVLDSIAEFSLTGDMFQTETQTKNPMTMPQLTEKEVEIVITEPEEYDQSLSRAPIALIFGWGGSSHKNVEKYSSIYRKSGCTTVQYVLPTRHLFRDTDQIPDIMDNILQQLDAQHIQDRPVYIHCLCDTGVMCYQGLDIAAKRSNKNLDIQGVVWDSCPGPYPEVTLIRFLVFAAVWILCCIRDWTNSEAGLKDSLYSAYFMLKDRVIPGIARKMQGKPIEFSLIQGKWAGHFGRDHCLSKIGTQELFLYSNNDYYLQYQYLENTVLTLRENMGAPYRAVKFEGSPHVAHLRNHKKAYTEEIVGFVTKGFKISHFTLHFA